MKLNFFHAIGRNTFSFLIMRSTIGVALALIITSPVSAVRGPDCKYDIMHSQGGQNPPCEYNPVPVATITVAGSSNPAFQVDGAHLSSIGAVKYMKQKKGMSPTDFLACSSPPCNELNIPVTR